MFSKPESPDAKREKEIHAKMRNEEISGNVRSSVIMSDVRDTNSPAFKLLPTGQPSKEPSNSQSPSQGRILGSFGQGKKKEHVVIKQQKTGSGVSTLIEKINNQRKVPATATTLDGLNREDRDDALSD